MGFDERWLNMVSKILDSGCSAILLNGVPGTEFKCKRGVRQGDPLSPLLFVAMGDVLQSVINTACEEGLLHLPIPQPASEDYPIIQYADDTIVVLPACPEQLQTIQSILQAFAQSTELVGIVSGENLWMERKNLIWSAYYDTGIPHAIPKCGSFWWKDVANLMPIFRGVSKCSIGAGDTILLWKDAWCNPQLSEASPRLFSYSLNEDISITDFVNEQNMGNLFQLPLSIEAHTELLQLQLDINEDTINRYIPDKWEFAWGKSAYKSKDFYQYCFRDVVAPEYLQLIWKSKCMMKHKVFAWLMLVDRINTRDMLRRRNMNIGSVFSCMLCDIGQDETRNHMFFSSSV
nr:uncharacterized protein LOC127319150 [Lolium perenne]